MSNIIRPPEKEFGMTQMMSFSVVVKDSNTPMMGNPKAMMSEKWMKSEILICIDQMPEDTKRILVLRLTHWPNQKPCIGLCKPPSGPPETVVLSEPFF
jgi:hypothetical protein